MRSPSVQAWTSTLPQSIVAGKGSESLLTAAHVFSALSRQRYAGSLDFPTCYDLMVPRGTAALLEAGGWPKELVRVIACMWQHQQRWVSWDSHTHPFTLGSGTCVPQRCSFGPLALAAWMAAGLQAMVHLGETGCLLGWSWMIQRCFLLTPNSWLTNPGTPSSTKYQNLRYLSKPRLKTFLN